MRSTWHVRVGATTYLSQLVQRAWLGTFRQSRVVVVVDVVVRRDRVGVEIKLLQLVQRTRLETFRQSRVVVVVDVVVVRRDRVGVETYLSQPICRSLCSVLGWKRSARAAWLLLLMLSSGVSVVV